VCVVDDGGAHELRTHSFHADGAHYVSERFQTEAGGILEPPIMRNLLHGAGGGGGGCCRAS
jgi:hypothetical protein